MVTSQAFAIFLREVGEDYGIFYLNLELMCLFKKYPSSF